MTLERWWMPTNALRRMQFLGWYLLPDGTRRRTPWINENGALEPEELLASELFRGDDIEPISDSIAIPERATDTSDVAAYLTELGWVWPPDETMALSTPALAARVSGKVYFLLGRGGLLVHFAPYPSFDTGSRQWTGSPLWAGFLLVCTNTVDGTSRPPFPPEQDDLWAQPLEYLAQQRPWFAAEADEASKWLTTHFATLRKQRTLNRGRRPFHLKG